MISIITPAEAEEIRLAIEGEMQELLGDACRVIAAVKNGRLVFSLGGSIPTERITQSIPGVFAYTINRFCRGTRDPSESETNQRGLPSRNGRHDGISRLRAVGS